MTAIMDLTTFLGRKLGAEASQLLPPLMQRTIFSNEGKCHREKSRDIMTVGSTQ